MGDPVVEFCKARLDERAARARAAMRGSEGRWSQVDPDREPGRVEDDRGKPVSYYEGSPTEEQADHMAANDPAYALRDVEAKRRIISEYERYVTERRRAMGGWDTYSEPSPVMLALASIDADHPDYLQEWALASA